MQKVNATNIMAFEAKVCLVSNTFRRPMSYQNIGIVGNFLPLLIKRLTPIQHERPIHEGGGPG